MTPAPQATARFGQARGCAFRAFDALGRRLPGTAIDWARDADWYLSSASTMPGVDHGEGSEFRREWSIVNRVWERILSNIAMRCEA